MAGPIITARQPLEKTARDAPSSDYLREETLWTDSFGCIPFSVTGFNKWASVSLDYPARVVLGGDGDIAGKSYKIDSGAVFMRFPGLRYEDWGDGLKAILGDPEFIR